MIRAKLVSLIICALILGVEFGLGLTPPSTTVLLLFAIGWVLGLLILTFDEAGLGDKVMSLLLPADHNQTPEGLPDSEESLFTRSAIFLLILPFLMIYVTSTSDSIIGYGLLLAIMITITAEMTILRQDSEAFRRRFLQQLQRPVSARGQLKIVVLAWAVCLATLFVKHF